MIRNLQPLDLLQMPLWRGGRVCERSFSLERMGRAGAPGPLPSIVRGQLAPRRRSFILVAEGDGGVVGIAEAQPRWGPRAWEISHLWAAVDAGGEVPDLLEQAALSAAGHGAQRVFLRLASDTPLLSDALRAGFRGAWQETLYARDQGPLPGRAEMSQQAVRPRCDADDLPLFRLYCATAPASVRSAVGMTMDEWRDAQTPGLQGLRRWVYDHEGDVKGSAEQWTHGDVRSAVVRGREEALPRLLGRALSSRSSRRARVLAPDYLASLHRVLESSGFVAEGRYVVLVRSVTAPVREVAFVPASV